MFTNKIFFLSLISCFHAYAGEQASQIPLTLIFSDERATTIRKPFLYRFIMTHQKPTRNNDLTLQLQKPLSPATELALHGLIAKPINAINTINPTGHDSDALLEAAGILGIRTDGTIHEHAPLNSFTRAFVQALIKKESVSNWCNAAQEDLVKTKCVPHKQADHPLNKLRYAIKWAHATALEDHGALICATAYQTGLIHQLYECMYSKTLQLVTDRPKKSYEAPTNAYLAKLQTALFDSPTWYFYAALHNVFDKRHYPDLLYGNTALVQNRTMHPTRHLHMAFHVNTNRDRTEYMHDHKPYFPQEITTPDSHSSHALTVKPLEAVNIYATEHPTTIHVSKLDLLLLATVVANSKSTCVAYNFATPQTEAEIAPDAYQHLTKLPHAVQINLGTVSPENAAQIEQNIEPLSHRTYESTREFNVYEYKRFHMHLPASGRHSPEHQHAPVKKVTFLDKNKQPGATLTYTVVDPDVRCDCR